MGGVEQGIEITAICPENLDTSAFKELYPSFSFEHFDSSYFASKHSYNHLMLSCNFYGRFLAWDYVLIYQTDAFVFRNELREWSDKGYDYIGAPWILKPKHKTLIYKICSEIKTAIGSLFGGAKDRHIARGKVGNGGFSLRKTKSCYDFLVAHPQLAEFYKSRSNNHRYYEDVFWAVEPRTHGADFRIPDVKEALEFSFDIYPDHAMKQNGGRLPFGCHGLFGKKRWSFWKPIIEKEMSK